MSRSLLLFESGIKSEYTKKKYQYYLKKFLDFAKIPNADGLLQLKDEHLQVIIEDYLIYQKNRVSPNSIPPMFAPIELFFAMNERNLNFKKIRKMFPATAKRSGNHAWTTADIQMILLAAKSRRNRAFVLFLASTGCRVGAIPDLKLRHMASMPNNCKAIQFYEDSNEEYWGFLTPEASKHMDEYLNERRKDGEALNPNSPLFRAIYKIGSSKAKPMALEGVKACIHRIVNSSDVQRQRVGTRFNIQIDHGFRKRFNTVLKLNNNVNSNIAEKILGHKNGLDGVYLTPTKEECFTEFQKAITDLTIDDSERLRAKNKILEAKQTDYDIMKNDAISTLSDQIMKLSEEVNKLKKQRSDQNIDH